MNKDKIVSDTIDAISDLPTKFRLKHNRSHSSKQKRVIRKAFNKIQPEFMQKVDHDFSYKSICGITPDQITKDIWSRVQAKAISYKEFKKLLVEYAAVRNERLKWAGKRFET